MNIVLRQQEYGADLLSRTRALEGLRGGDGYLYVVGVDQKGERQMTVTIYGPRKAMWSPEGDEWYSEPAQVSAHSFSSDTPENARVFATMLRTAADLADEVNATLTFRDRDTAWEAYQAHRELVTAGHEDTDGNVLHEQDVEDCRKCQNRKRAIAAAEEAAKLDAAKAAQRRADKLYRTANNRYDLWPAGPIDNEQAQQAMGQFTSRVWRIGTCEERPRRDRTRKHEMNAAGQCRFCSKSIDLLETAMANVLQEVSGS